jgi:gliding motility-associated-like protein
MLKLRHGVLLICAFFPRILLGQLIDPTPVFSVESATDANINFARQNADYRKQEAAMNRVLLRTPVTLDNVYTLPVVFHIVGTDSIKDADISAALKDLNDAFGKRGKYAASKGIDTKIQFCLAKTAPDGGVTNGITRVNSFLGNNFNRSIEDDRLKSLGNWDPNRFINIWFVKTIEDENFVLFGCSMVNGSQWKRNNSIGYATMPSEVTEASDGIVVSQFGSVLAHEMGHYLGLYHTFEGGCNNTDCSINGDRVCDTPPESSWLPSSCTDPLNSCNTDTLSNYSNGFFKQDVPDQVDNFMDYNNWTCANRFTIGQTARMRKAIVAFRNKLLKSACNPPCADSIVASFTTDIPYPAKGDTVTFTNTSYGATSYKWFLNDTLLSSSFNYGYRFSDTGTYRLTLKAFSSGNCFASTTNNIIIKCGVTARFFTDKQRIASQTGFAIDSILFTNTSENGVGYKWLIQNDAGMAEQVVSNAQNLVYTFTNPGNYQVRLVASNGSCNDTSLLYQVPVLDPRPDARPVIYRADCYENTRVRLVFGICNSGYTPIAPGAPVSFYEGDPTKPGAVKIGSTFLLPDTVRGGGRGLCCSPQYTEIIDIKRSGVNKVYVSFNDKGDAIPVKYPGSDIIEKNYDNNYSSESLFQYNITVNPASVTLLPGDTIQLATMDSPPGSFSTFDWTPTAYLSCTDCATPTLTADSSRTFFVTAKSSFNCTDTAKVVVKVPAAYDYTLTIDSISCKAGSDSLDVKFTVSDSYKRPLLPEGLSVAFYSGNPVTGVATLLNQIFTLPASSHQSQLSFTTSIKAIGKGTLYGVVNDTGTTFPLKLPNTRFAETNYTNNVASKTYDPLTVTTLKALAVCEGDSIKLSASSNNANAIYTWTGPGNFISTEQNPVIISGGQFRAGPYIVTASLNGCTSPADTITVVINELPVVDAAYNAPVCENGTLNLSASGDSTNKYFWQGPAGFSSQKQNPTTGNILTDKSGDYQVFAISVNNCKSVVQTVNVKVNPAPVANFSAPDVCLPSPSVLFKNESTITSGSIAGYSWNFGDPASGIFNTDSVANPSHTYNTYGKYTVTLKLLSDQGCAGSVSKLYDGIHKQPLASFVTVHTAGVCLNDTITFTDKSSRTDGAITLWTWQAGDGSAAVTYDNGSTPFVHTYSASGSYSATLTIKDEFGCQNDTTVLINILSPPVVEASYNAPVCENGNLTLNASGEPGNTYTWQGPANFVSNDQNPVISNMSANKAGDYKVYAVSVSDCKSAVKTVTVKVSSAPVANFSAPDVCLPLPTVLFKNESTISSGNIAGYKWSFGDPTSGAANTDSVANPTHTYAAYGKYTVTLTLTSNEGCTGSISKLYAGIHRQPSASFSTDPSAGVCLNDTITFTDKSSDADGSITSWTWQAGDGSAAVTYDNGTTPFVHTYTAYGSFTATLNIKNDFGCVNDTSLPVKIFSLPSIDAGYDAPVCENGTLTLHATGEPGNTYTWQGPANFVSNNQNPAISNMSANKSGDYQVFATSVNNCKSAIKTVSVTVSPAPVANFSAPDVCLPLPTVLFKNESTISAGNIAGYKWNFGDPASGASNTDSVANPNHTYTAFGKYLVTLTLTSNEGCTGAISKLYTGIHRQPLANFDTDNPNGVCLNEAITFSDKSTGDDGTISSWTWQAGDGSAAITYDNGFTHFVHTYASAGTYNATLSIKNDFGCQNDTSLPVKIFSLPMVDAGPDQLVLQGRPAQLFGKTSGDVVKLEWTPSTWLSSSSVASPVVNNPLSDILYTLTGETINGCSATDQVLVKILYPLQIPNAFSPNGDGINDVWNVKYLADYPGATVEIFDRYGKLVFRSVGYNKPWDGNFNGGPVPVGVYYYIITPKNNAPTVNGSVTVLR